MIKLASALSEKAKLRVRKTKNKTLLRRQKELKKQKKSSDFTESSSDLKEGSSWLDKVTSWISSTFSSILDGFSTFRTFDEEARVLCCKPCSSNGKASCAQPIKPVLCSKPCSSNGKASCAQPIKPVLCCKPCSSNGKASCAQPIKPVLCCMPCSSKLSQLHRPSKSLHQPLKKRMHGPAFSSDNAGDGPDNTDPKKRLRTDSRENKHFSEDLRKKRRAEDDGKSKCKYPENDESIDFLFNEMKDCCARGGKKGCLYCNFKLVDESYDTTLARAELRHQLDRTRTKNKTERKNFLATEFAENCKFDPKTNKYTSNFKLTLSTGKCISVCRKVWALSSGYSLDALNRLSVMKKLPEGYRQAEKSQKFTEATVLPFSYGEVAEIFEENVGYAGFNIIRLQYRPTSHYLKIYFYTR